MKKFYTLALLLLLALTLSIFMVGCDKEDEPTGVACPDGEHEFSVWQVEKTALCNEKGLQSRICVKCQLYKQQRAYSDSDNHDFVDAVCVRCGEMKGTEEVGFVLSADKKSYILHSIDDKSITEYEVPAKYDGLPVRTIASNAFKDCSSLEILYVPSSVTTIEKGAFAGCYSLKKITLPFVGESKTSDFCNFAHVFGAGESIVQYPNDTETGYWLPSGLIDVTITGGTLKKGCFQNCSRLKRIEYKGSDEYVHDYAFSGCVSLTSLTLPKSIENLGDYAFQYCQVLDIFPLYEGINYVGKYCFAGCSGTSTLYIPNSLIEIGECAFSDCLAVTNVTIPKNVKRLPDNLFQNCSALETVTIENGVERLGDGVFTKCTRLASITIPSSVKAIGKNAFDECINLVSITIPASVQIISAYTFNSCLSLKDVTIENGVIGIDKCAFYECSDLQSIYLPASIATIDETSFTRCTRLSSIMIDPENKSFAQIDGHILSADKTNFILYSPGSKAESYEIPEGVKNVYPTAFDYAVNLKEITFPSSMGKIPNKLFYQNTNLKGVVIKAGITVIGEEAFAGCTALTSVKISDALTISERAFTQCTALRSVVISNVETIGEGAFFGCGSINSLEISGVNLIDKNAFAECVSIETIVFGENVIDIGTEAFAGCSNLKTVTLSPSITSIGEFAFSNCVKLEVFNLVEGIVNIKEAAFKNCPSLKGLNIPLSLVSLNAYAFDGCYGLTEFTVADGHEVFKAVEGHLVDHRNTLIVFAPGQFGEEISIPNGITSIGLYVFRNAKMIKKVTLPSSLTTIGSEAFYNSGLTEINLNYVSTIGTYAFGKCLSLTEISIPKSVTEIKDYAFQDSINLKNVYIRDTMTNMGYAIFHVTDTLKKELGITEAPEITVYLEFTKVPETWSEGWTMGGNILQIPGHNFGN